MQDGLLVTLRQRRQAALITYQALDRLAAVITDAPAQCEVLELVRCSGTESFAPDQCRLDYLWDFGDGTSATGSAVEHAYTQPGDYTIRLTVADQKNATDTTATVVSVKSLDTTPPAVTAVAAGASNCVEVVFSEPVQQASAETPANYAIDQGIEVLSARLRPIWSPSRWQPRRFRSRQNIRYRSRTCWTARERPSRLLLVRNTRFSTTNCTHGGN